MSPEQARGRVADRRADIWAFGCVLYEMITGRPPFEGHDVAEVLASVLKAEPDWDALPATTPHAVRLCLRRCLQKDARERFHDICDVRLALAGAFDSPHRASTCQRPRLAARGPVGPSRARRRGALGVLCHLATPRDRTRRKHVSKS